jgi:seryl-tRNA synthetase
LQRNRLTEAVTKGLELLINPTTQKDDNKLQEERIKELKEEIVISKKQLEEKNKELQVNEGIIKNNDKNHNEIISHLKDQIAFLVDQMKIKDIQIEKLNDALQSQVINIHNLIQENTKLLPENKGKKRWWEFWKV